MSRRDGCLAVVILGALYLVWMGLFIALADISVAQSADPSLGWIAALVVIIPVVVLVVLVAYARAARRRRRAEREESRGPEA
jgi:membrane protein implicated in regulation of membrane protease activity